MTRCACCVSGAGLKPAWLCRHCNFASSSRHIVLLHEARHVDEHRDRVNRQRAWRQSGVVRWCPERPFRCAVCGQGFSQKMNLARHMQRHTGEKPHQCHLCPMRFNQKCNLERHVRSHTGERPFHCAFCPKSFNSKSNLSRHETGHMTQAAAVGGALVVADFDIPAAAEPRAVMVANFDVLDHVQ